MLASDRPRRTCRKSLSRLATSGAPLEASVHELAHLLPAFHAAAERGPSIDAAARAETVASRFEENARRLGDLPSALHDPARSAQVVDLARRYLAGRGPLFDDRIARKAVCDGHGDLLADDIFILEDGPRVLDCLEFDDALRYGDVLGDVAFLAMDFERLGRRDLAQLLLARYGELANDRWPASLAHLYVAYRAQVRALVAAVRAHQGGGDGAAAPGLLQLAVDHLEAGAIHLVVVGGPPGSGKSTLAGRLGAAIDGVVLRSDELRKQAAGLDAGAPASTRLGEGLYAPEVTEATYGALLDRAGTCLAHGLSVVLDATFAQARFREAATLLARRGVANLTELRCNLPSEVAAQRIAARARTDASDATPEIAAAIAGREEPWPTAIEVDTSKEPAGALEQALRIVGRHASLRSRP